MKRTQEEIDRQVKGLLEMKQTMPRKSFFGGDNWKVIDAQINVITGTKKPDYYYVDETQDDYRDGDNDLWSEAERAERWLNGEEKNDLFEL
jgi:hypothetical protein